MSDLVLAIRRNKTLQVRIKHSHLFLHGDKSVSYQQLSPDTCFHDINFFKEDDHVFTVVCEMKGHKL